MEVLIIHHHIFKNAGSTVDSILLEHFGKKGAVFYDKVVGPGAKHYLSGDEVEAVLRKNTSAVSFSSHQTHGQLFEFSNKQIIDLLLVRHPLLRLKSIHSFHKKNLSMKTPMALAAQQNDFPGYVRLLMDGNLSQAVNNPQVRILGTGSVYRCPKPERDTLELAQQRAMTVQCLGTVEQFDLSMAYAESIIEPLLPNCSIDFTYKAVNKTSDVTLSTSEKLASLKLELGAPLYEEALGLNHLDVELWSFAQGLLRGRCQGVKGLESRCTRISGSEK